MKITQEVRAWALEQAGRRCECAGDKCRHHLRGARCKRGLRGDDWRIFWRSENGGTTRGNVEAWCLECFDNNFVVPRETVALLATEIAEYARLFEQDQRRAITLKSVLRDAAERAAGECRGRMVLDRLDDDVVVEFATSPNAVDGARALRSRFEEIAHRLDLPVPEICAAIHLGEVTRWRNGLLAGEALQVTADVRSMAGVGQLVITEPAIAGMKGVDLEPVAQDVSGLSSVGSIWALRL